MWSNHVMSLAGRRPTVQVCGYECSVGAVLVRLDAGEREALESMLADPAWSGPAIYEALEDEGFQVGKQTVNRHRRGFCRCKRSQTSGNVHER